MCPDIPSAVLLLEQIFAYDKIDSPSNISTYEKSSLLFVVAFTVTISFTSCETVTNKVEKQLDNLTDKNRKLDSLVDTEVDKVMQLDSVVIKEQLKNSIR